MTIKSNSNPDRIVPVLPAGDQKMRLLIDSDAANEIDDLFAIALAVTSPERFDIEGFVATHYAAGAIGPVGPESTERSYKEIVDLLAVAGLTGQYKIARGAEPMQYKNWPSSGEGVDFIIERAHAGSSNNPLWIVVLGAATNIASALLKDPSIAPRIRVVFHSRCPEHWPTRSVQFNVKGDVWSVRSLLETEAPLVWFDTGTNLVRSYEHMADTVGVTGKLGDYLVKTRQRSKSFMRPDKGFFDLADIAWMMRPELCREEILPAPSMDQCMFFDQENVHGKMRRVHEIDNDPTWDLLCEKLSKCACINEMTTWP